MSRETLEDWTLADIDSFKRLIVHEIEVQGPKDVLGYARQAVRTIEEAKRGDFVRGSMKAYERACESTAIYPGKGEAPGLIYTALGLAGESGEFADKVKKLLRDADGKVSEERRSAMIAELGDVLWYVARAASELGTDLETVAQWNVNKLSSRKERGKLGGSGDER